MKLIPLLFLLSLPAPQTMVASPPIIKIPGLFKYSREFYAVRFRVAREPDYVCRHAIYDFWKLVGPADSQAIVVRFRNGDNHVVLRKHLLYYDPTCNRVSRALPTGGIILYTLDRLEQCPEEWCRPKVEY